MFKRVEHENYFITSDTCLFLQGWKGKSKSSHDLANDPKLSAVPVFEKEENLAKGEKRELETQV